MIRILTALLLFIAATAWPGVIPPERLIDWSRAGTRGPGIINRTTLRNVKTEFGAVGNGVADDTASVKAAISAAANNQVVYFPAGTYKIGSGLSFNKSITIRGDGPAASVIRYTSSSAADIISVNNGHNYGSAISISSGTTQGSTLITLSSATSINVGDFVLVYGDNQPFMNPVGEDGTCSWCGDDDYGRSAKQCTRIVAKSGNTVAIDDPLYISLGANPKMKTISMTQSVGIENIGVCRSSTASTSGEQILFGAVANSWITNVWSTNTAAYGFYFQFCYGVTIRKCLAWDATSYGSDHAYQFYGKFWNSGLLFEDNISYKGRHDFVLEGGGSGCVFAYNYGARGGQNGEDPIFQGESEDTHGAHPFMNLYEGNDIAELNHDNTWGSSSHNVHFREWVENYSQPSFTESRAAVDVMANQKSNSFVALVIGRPGDTGVKVFPVGGDMYDGHSKWAYRLGFTGVSTSSSFDAGVSNSSHFHYTYDYYSKSRIDKPGYDLTGIPASLYLPSRPSWIYNRSWPIFGPDTASMTNVNAARYRYEHAMADPPPAGGPVVPPAPTRLRVKP